MTKHVLITGGAGYVGAMLVPNLIDQGYKVTVLDLFIYGEDVFSEDLKENKNLTLVKGDIRDKELLLESMKNVDCVIHLACISNDPSFDLNPQLGKQINLDAFRPLVEISKASGVNRFIYASSSSVYGVKEDSNVHEEMTLEPLTDYSKFKAQCEKILDEYSSEDFTTVTVRPATVCGYSPRQRLDVIVNILANHAFHNRKIKVFGGAQLRPNINIKDMVTIYSMLLELPHDQINRKIYNAGYENHSVDDLANIVKDCLGEDIKIERTATDDNRSYHISSEKIKKELGFTPKYTIKDAVESLKVAFQDKVLVDPMENKKYYNIKTMLDINLR